MPSPSVRHRQVRPVYVVIVGYFVAGIPGAISGVLALVSPAMLAIPIARLVARGESGAIEGACSGIVIAACALMIVTGVRFIPQVATDGWYVAAIAAGTLTLAFTSIKSVWVIVAAGSRPGRAVNGQLASSDSWSLCLSLIVQL